MIEKEEFEMLSKAYAPIVAHIINGNVNFYRFNETIRWCFAYDENISIMASCNKNTNVVSINLKSFMNYYFNKDLKTIEYYLLHEIRHAFQHSIIADYKNGVDIPIDSSIVEKWISEGESYVTALDNNGNENKAYFLQDCEMDAYAFSYAVMKYKYGDVSELYVPNVYGNDFYKVVDDWVKAFKREEISWR